MRKILVCLDGSSLSERILPYVRQEATDYFSKIVLLQVVSTVHIVGSFSLTPHLGVPALIDRLIRDNVQKARTYLEKVAVPLRNAGLEVDCIVLTGTVAEEIVRYAKENEVDCIALVSRERNWWSRLIFGSVAETVIRETRLPALLLKPGPAGNMLCEKLRFREGTWGTRIKEAVFEGKTLSGV